MSLAQIAGPRVLRLLWPAHCLGCDQVIASDATVFCEPCGLSVDVLARPCPGCALPLHRLPEVAPSSESRCPRCQRVPLAFTSADAGFAYGEAMSEAIIRMKNRRRDVVPGLARLLAPVLFRVLARQPALDVIVPVPLHPQRLKQREFNQALELARAALRLVEKDPERLARAAPLTPGPPWPLPTLVRHGLVRQRHTRSLGHLGPAERLREVSGAFAVRTPAAFEGKRVLVVDDVMTTGATFHSCAEALLAAGAAEVRVLALARAVV